MRRTFTDLTNSIEGWNECLESNFFFQSSNDVQILNEKKSPVTSENVNVEFDSAESNLRSIFDVYGRYSEIQEVIQLGPYYRTEHEEEKKPQTEKRSAKQQKSGLYSKNYREKKKEHMKMLEEENIFLKKKVDQLQHRLRQKEIQLNRIKFSPTKDQFNIQKISEEISQKLTLIAQQNFGNADSNNSFKKQSSSEKQKKIAQFLNFYENDGPGGKKTMELLEYYMNEFLENMMRDREKFYFLKCVKTQAQLKQKSGLDIALMEVFESSEENQKKFMVFCKLMRPVCLELKDTCIQFYRSYKRVMNILERKHETLKYYLSENRNVDFLKRRLKIILWFQAKHYRKEMRKLREEWIKLIKDEDGQYEIQGSEPLKKSNY